MSTMVDKHSFYDYYLFSEAHDRQNFPLFPIFDCRTKRGGSPTNNFKCVWIRHIIIIPNVITSVAWPKHYDEIFHINFYDKQCHRKKNIYNLLLMRTLIGSPFPK